MATDIREDDIIGFSDSGLVKSGKSGELITKDAFYVSLRKAKIPYLILLIFLFFTNRIHFIPNRMLIAYTLPIIINILT